jgi:hypothetical protein
LEQLLLLHTAIANLTRNFILRMEMLTSHTISVVKQEFNRHRSLRQEAMHADDRPAFA